MQDGAKRSFSHSPPYSEYGAMSRIWSHLSKITFPARSRKNITLTRPLPHEPCETMLIIFFPILFHTLKMILGTSKCSWGYGPPMEMGIVSNVCSHPQLRLVKVSA